MANTVAEDAAARDNYVALNSVFTDLCTSVNLPDVFQPATQLPVVDNPIADITVNEDADPDTIILSNVFSDPESSLLIFSAVNSNADLLLAQVSNDTLHLRYDADSSGTARLIVSANDISSGSVSDTFNVTVNALNDAPTVVNPIADLTVDEDAPSTTITLPSIVCLQI